MRDDDLQTTIRSDLETACSLRGYSIVGLKAMVTILADCKVVKWKDSQKKPYIAVYFRGKRIDGVRGRRNEYYESL